MADAFRQEWGRITAALIHQTGDWDLAEECAQDAFAQALRRWPRDGVPNRPGAWLMTVARNAAIDRLRRESARADKHAEAALLHASDQPDEEEGPVRDDRLRLMFTCCHRRWAPALRWR